MPRRLTLPDATPPITFVVGTQPTLLYVRVDPLPVWGWQTAQPATLSSLSSTRFTPGDCVVADGVFHSYSNELGWHPSEPILEGGKTYLVRFLEPRTLTLAGTATSVIDNARTSPELRFVMLTPRDALLPTERTFALEQGVAHPIDRHGIRPAIVLRS